MNQTNSKFQKPKSTGITLIALVVTIIVLLILAGVTLALVAGSDGILGKATSAVDSNQIAMIQEKVELKVAEEVENFYESKYVNYSIDNSYVAFDYLTAKDDETAKTARSTIFEAGAQYTISYGTQTSSPYSIAVKYENGSTILDGITDDSTKKIKELTGTITDNGVITWNAVAENSGETEEPNPPTPPAPTITRPNQDAIASPDKNVSFPTDFGRIEVIWLDGTTNAVTDKPNAPDLYESLGEQKLKPIVFNEETKQWDECSKTDANWYNYQASTGWNDDKQSRWANSLNTDGSYFVWIPRFAYRITYYESSTSTVPTGFYDGDGMWKAEDGAVKYKMDEGIETVEHNGFNYIVHPAFMKDTEKVSSTGAALEDYGRGGWSSNLTGFWIAKFSMSQEIDGVPTDRVAQNCYLTTNAGSTSEKSIVAVSKPNVFGFSNSCQVNLAYKNCFYYDRDKESHLVKGTEYGAFVYLTHSQYGRNGHGVSINQSTNKRHGMGRGLGKNDIANESYHWYYDATEEQFYDGSIGVLSSSSGNIYGVYDLQKYEWLASWGKYDARGKLTNSYYRTLTGSSEEAIASRYDVSEENRAGTYAYETIFTGGRIGDASKELSNGRSLWGLYGHLDWHCQYDYRFANASSRWLCTS